MPIWKQSFHLDDAKKTTPGTMIEHLGIEITEIGDDFVCGRMPVDTRTHQPLGIMHGGASCVLAETLGSIAAKHCVSSSEIIVGVEINTSHIKSIREGFVIGIAKPFHLGRTTQVWEILIYDEKDNLISVNRLRIAVLEKK